MKKKRPRTCQRCGGPLADRFCTDETCPFSAHRQNCPVGWANHPDMPACQDKVCNCGGRIKAEVHSDDHAFEVPFDAIPWFQHADAEEITALVPHHL